MAEINNIPRCVRLDQAVHFHVISFDLKYIIQNFLEEVLFYIDGKKNVCFTRWGSLDAHGKCLFLVLEV